MAEKQSLADAAAQAARGITEQAMCRRHGHPKDSCEVCQAERIQAKKRAEGFERTPVL